jgi:hypothetical protein
MCPINKKPLEHKAHAKGLFVEIDAVDYCIILLQYSIDIGGLADE